MANDHGQNQCFVNCTMQCMWRHPEWAAAAARVAEESTVHLGGQARQDLAWRCKRYKEFFTALRARQFPRLGNAAPNAFLHFGGVRLDLLTGGDPPGPSAAYRSVVRIPDSPAPGSDPAGREVWWQNAGLRCVRDVDDGLREGTVLLWSADEALALAVALGWIIYCYPHPNEAPQWQLCKLALRGVGKENGLCELRPLLAAFRRLRRRQADDRNLLLRFGVLREFRSLLAQRPPSEPGNVLDASQLRASMALARPCSFGEQRVGEVWESMEFLLTLLHEEEARRSGSQNTAAREWWRLEVKRSWKCERCGEACEPSKESVWYALLHASQLAASDDPKAFASLLLPPDEARTCDKRNAVGGRCGGSMPCEAALDGPPPRLLTVAVQWSQRDSAQLSREALRQTLSAIPADFSVKDALGRAAAGRRARLWGVVFYFGNHFTCALFCRRTRAWVAIDDRRLSAVARTVQGLWRYVVAACVMPQLLLYEVLQEAPGGPQPEQPEPSEPAFEGELRPPPLLRDGRPNRTELLDWLRRTTSQDLTAAELAAHTTVDVDALARAVARGDTSGVDELFRAPDKRRRTGPAPARSAEPVPPCGGPAADGPRGASLPAPEGAALPQQQQQPSAPPLPAAAGGAGAASAEVAAPVQPAAAAATRPSAVGTRPGSAHAAQPAASSPARTRWRAPSTSEAARREAAATAQPPSEELPQSAHRELPNTVPPVLPLPLPPPSGVQPAAPLPE
eukprot:TRINITY_DN1444_c2_g3_i1.p1 TRINITY_DN1444_c2_g3~~TRINITY_DN1444_c2_g3_i1.p1  ORF type:complete len:782 (+),score=192.58 TRINITY_DN1444_c2_g3_i1:138-2348(+)